MRFLIVAPRFVQKIGHYYIFPLGLAYVSGALKEAGHEVHCINLNHIEGPVEDLVEKAVRNFDPDVMATGALSVHYNLIKPILSASRRAKPSIINLLGNGLLSAEPELIVEAMDVDIGVVGEGEETIVELASVLEKGSDLANVNGLVFKDSEGKVRANCARKPIRHLDLLPWPDYDGLEFETHLSFQRSVDHHFFFCTDNPRAISIVSSRSCPFACTFCYHPIGRVYRERSLDNVFQEIDYLVERYQINMISILDELFSVQKERMIEFCQRIKKYDIKWMAQLRVDSVDDVTLEMMQDAGCAYISYGLESMSPEVLKSMLKKAKPETTVKILDATYRKKIGIQGNFIFGDPAETLETAKRTIRWWGDNRRYLAWLGAIQCYPGTTIYKRAVASGKIKSRLKFLEDACPILNMSSMDDGSWSKLHQRIEFLNRVMLYPGYDLHIEPESKSDPHRGELYRIECNCPHCHDRTIFRMMPIDLRPFGRETWRLSCRTCSQRFDLPIPPVNQRFSEDLRVVLDGARRIFADGNLKRAFELVSTAINSEPSCASARALMGMILVRVGNLEDGIRALEHAVDLDPLDYSHHLALAGYYRQIGEDWLARLHYQQTLILAPDEISARENLSKMEEEEALETVPLGANAPPSLNLLSSASQ